MRSLQGSNRYPIKVAAVIVDEIYWTRRLRERQARYTFSVLRNDIIMAEDNNSFAGFRVIDKPSHILMLEEKLSMG